MSTPKLRTIAEKVWDNHVVAEKAGAPTLIFIDLHLCQDRKSTRLNSSH